MLNYVNHLRFRITGTDCQARPYNLLFHNFIQIVTKILYSLGLRSCLPYPGDFKFMKAGNTHFNQGNTVYNRHSIGDSHMVVEHIDNTLIWIVNHPSGLRVKGIGTTLVLFGSGGACKGRSRVGSLFLRV